MGGKRKNGAPRAAFSPLLRALAPVAVAAQHLAVARNGAPAVPPRRDGIRLHLRQLEVRPAQRADTKFAGMDSALKGRWEYRRGFRFAAPPPVN